MLFAQCEGLHFPGVVGYIMEMWVSFAGHLADRRAALIESSETIQEWAVYLLEWKERARKLMPLSRRGAIPVSMVLGLMRGSARRPSWRSLASPPSLLRRLARWPYAASHAA